MASGQFKGALIIAFAFAVVCGFSLTPVGPLETWIVDDLSISHGGAGLMQSAFMLGNVAGSLVAGGIFRVTRAKAFGVISLLATAAGSILAGIKCYEVVLIGRFATGLGNAGSLIFFSTIIVSSFRRRQGVLLSVLHAVLAAGAVLMLVMARPLGVYAGSWSAPFWITGGMAFCVAAWLAWSVLPEAPPADRVRIAAVGKIIRHPVVLASLLLLVGYTVAEQALTTFFPAFAEEERQFSVGTAARTAAMYWLGIGLGRLASAFMARKAAEQWVIIVSALIGSILFACSVLVRQNVVLMAAVFLAGCAIGPIVPLGVSYVVKRVGYLEATVISICNIVCCLGGALGAATAGYVADRHSLQAGLGGSYLVFFVSILPLLWVSVREAAVAGRAE